MGIWGGGLVTQCPPGLPSRSANDVLAIKSKRKMAGKFRLIFSPFFCSDLEGSQSMIGIEAPDHLNSASCVIRHTPDKGRGVFGIS